MKNIATLLVATGASVLFSQELLAQPVPAPLAEAAARTFAPPPEVAHALPNARLHGQANMRFLGMAIYQAALWVEPGFDPNRWEQQRFALQLTYQRDLKGRAIAQRSVVEMRRQGPLDDKRATEWEARMAALFPDVTRGDRITGLYVPGQGARFVGNGRELGEVADPGFARQFFGIWLAPQTSEPTMRTALLGAQP